MGLSGLHPQTSGLPFVAEKLSPRSSESCYFEVQGLFKSASTHRTVPPLTAQSSDFSFSL